MNAAEKLAEQLTPFGLQPGMKILIKGKGQFRLAVHAIEQALAQARAEGMRTVWAHSLKLGEAGQYERANALGDAVIAINRAIEPQKDGADIP